VLSAIADPALRDSLVAREDGPGALRFDVRLQGDRPTAFFAL
jgi:protocatechuate 3,4-dioxygenase beta subunit